MHKANRHNLPKSNPAIPSFRHLIEYISNELLPYDSDNTIRKLFNSIEKYIKETDNKQSAIAMYEIQDSLSQLRINKQHPEKTLPKDYFNNSISTKITVFITVTLKKALPKIVGMPYFIGFSTLFICLMFSSSGTIKHL